MKKVIFFLPDILYPARTIIGQISSGNQYPVQPYLISNDESWYISLEIFSPKKKIFKLMKKVFYMEQKTRVSLNCIQKLDIISRVTQQDPKKSESQKIKRRTGPKADVHPR